MAPETSVILTAYQRTTFIRECLASVLSQTRAPVEVIVADDSGSEEIRAICLGTGDPRVKHSVPERHPLGACGNILHALQIAQGEYVSIVNDDDWWAPHYVESLAGPLDDGYSLAFSDHWVTRADGTIDDSESLNCSRLYGRDQLEAGPIRDVAELELSRSSVPMSCAAMFRLSALPRCANELAPGGAYDTWLVYALAKTSIRTFYVNQRLSYYRWHESNETSRRDEGKHSDIVFIYDKLFTEDWFPEHRELVRARLFGSLMSQGKNLSQFGRSKAARASFHRAWRLTRSPKALAGLVLGLVPPALRPRQLRPQT